jgi:hypothetical protein
MLINKTGAVIAVLFLGSFPRQLQAQSICHPNYGLKSHQTLVIKRVETGGDSTHFYMSIENRITGGTFCADRNICVVYPDGRLVKLLSSSGIPVCPDMHSFREPGEKLEFRLTFPSLEPGTRWIDLVEECDDNCFSFYGITLDTGLNREIDDAFALVEKKTPGEALGRLASLAASVEGKNTGIDGLLLITMIQLTFENGDLAVSSEWYRKLEMSGIPRLNQYLRYLSLQGIKF